MQGRLRKERLSVSVSSFARELEGSDRHPAIAPALWELLQERAFVDDFRPKADDDLYKVFAMDPEIVRDEMIEPLLARLEAVMDL